MLTRVFVYGSLRHGFGNNSMLHESKFVGYAKTNPRFTMVDLDHFPGVVEKGDTPITGELYDVDENTLDSLDHLEGHPDFYERKSVVVADDSGKIQSAEIYILPEMWMEDAPVVISGDWRLR